MVTTDEPQTAITEQELRSLRLFSLQLQVGDRHQRLGSEILDKDMVNFVRNRIRELQQSRSSARAY